MTLTRMFGTGFLIYLLFIAACSGGGSNSSFPKLPGDDPPILDGYLYDSDNNPIPDATIKITDPNGNLLDETETDEFGHFSFDVNPDGDYKIFTRTNESGGQEYAWEYTLPSDDLGVQNPGQASDGGVVSPDGKIKISIPGGGLIQPLGAPSEEEVEIGAGGPTMFLLRGTNSMLKIRPGTDLESLESIMRIEGARGEHEAFQVVPVLLDGVNQINDVEVAASDITKGSDRILKQNITIYKEYYVNVTEVSDKGGATGLWPDALVPLTDPFDVADNMPSPIWIDINIPRNAVPGVYSGNIRFSTPDDGSCSYSYSLEVWNITLPMKLAMKAEFGLDQEDIAGAHGLETGLMTPSGRAMALKYAEFLAKRHISFHGVPLLGPTVEIGGDNRSVILDFMAMDADIDKFLRDYDLPVFNFPLDRFDCIPSGAIGHDEAAFTDDFNARFIDYVEQVSGYLSTRGYLNRAYIQLMDEPNSSGDYELVRDWADLLHQASIYPKYMITEQPAPENESWGTLTNHVDIFTSGLRAFYNMGGEENARIGGENKEEWLYTNANVYPFPSFAIDKQGIETRLFLWFAYQHGFDGIFYFSACNWTQANPWVDPLTFGSGFGNGCGSLLYPGSCAQQYTGQNNVDGPITSIRLELIRDGLEDAHLLWMLGGGAPVPEADALMTSWFDWSDNPEELLNVREQLAEEFGV